MRVFRPKNQKTKKPLSIYGYIYTYKQKYIQINKYYIYTYRGFLDFWFFEATTLYLRLFPKNHAIWLFGFLVEFWFFGIPYK